MSAAFTCDNCGAITDSSPPINYQLGAGNYFVKMTTHRRGYFRAPEADLCGPCLAAILTIVANELDGERWTPKVIGNGKRITEDG